MNISKKLFLMAVLSLLGLQLNASEKKHSLANAQELLKFITDMEKSSNVNMQTAANWMNQVFLTSDSYHNNITKKLISIVSADTTLESKIVTILQLKANSEKEIKEMEKTNKKTSFLSNIGSPAGIFSAIIVTIGVLAHIYNEYNRYKITSMWS